MLGRGGFLCCVGVRGWRKGSGGQAGKGLSRSGGGLLVLRGIACPVAAVLDAGSAGIAGVPLPRAGAGMCARRRSNFLSRRRKKVTKERATPLSVSPSLRFGATCGARFRRGPRKLAWRLKQRAALIRLKLCSSARPEGKGSRAALRAIAALGPARRDERGAFLGAGSRCSAAKLVLRPQSRNGGHSAGSLPMRTCCSGFSSR